MHIACTHAPLSEQHLLVICQRPLSGRDQHGRQTLTSNFRFLQTLHSFSHSLLSARLTFFFLTSLPQVFDHFDFFNLGTLGVLVPISAGGTVLSVCPQTYLNDRSVVSVKWVHEFDDFDNIWNIGLCRDTSEYYLIWTIVKYYGEWDTYFHIRWQFRLDQRTFFRFDSLPSAERSHWQSTTKRFFSSAACLIWCAFCSNP